MVSNYKRLTLSERVNIEEYLDKRVSARKIAERMGRSNSSVCEEVKTNKSFATGKHKGQQANIDLTKINNAKFCPKLLKWPYVCNGCKNRHYHCYRPIKIEYNAEAANAISNKTLVETRKGVNISEKEFLHILETTKIDLRKNLSPYAISQLHNEFNVSPSTIYRWVKNGYGGLTVMDLQKQVKYKPRQKHQLTPTKHGENRSYKALCELGDDVNGSVCEIDTVIGRKYDEQCLLTIYLRSCKLQIVLLLKRKSCEEVYKKFNDLELLLGVDDFRRLFGYILTDNGIEFADYDLLEKSQEFKNNKDKRCTIYYCDVRASNQKGGCEKNHVEIRKVIPKRHGIVFDRLVPMDITYINCQINSTPRKSLGGKTPIHMFKYLFGSIAEKVLAFLGIEELKTSELNLTLSGINNDRKKRGLSKLND